jgi:hypothetical protein
MFHSHPVLLAEEQFAQECTITQLRRGGPGGQHRNKVSTGIVLTHVPSGLNAEANERRSQVDNRRVAVRRLREILAMEQRSVVSDQEVAGDNDQRDMIRKKYAGSQLRVAEDNWERPMVLAVLLDDIYQLDLRLPEVAQRWATTTSQLVRFLRNFPVALVKLNRLRAERLLPPLR